MLIIATLPAGLGVTREGLAQLSPAKGAEKTADEYAKEAREFALKKDFHHAHPLYIEAWKRKKSYDVAGNLAGAELEIGKMRDAVEPFAFCVIGQKPEPPDGSNVIQQGTAIMGGIVAKVMAFSP